MNFLWSRYLIVLRNIFPCNLVHFRHAINQRFDILSKFSENLSYVANATSYNVKHSLWFMNFRLNCSYPIK